MSTPATRRRASAARATTPTATTTTASTSRSMGRLELVAWLNRALRSDYASVQECGDGVAYAQLLDAMHPGKVPLHRFDFNARFVGDNERNVRVLAQTMRALGTRVDVDFDALAKGKFTVRETTTRRDERGAGSVGWKSRSRLGAMDGVGEDGDRIGRRRRRAGESRRLGFEREARAQANARLTIDRSTARGAFANAGK